ncbi:hypothetical protein AAFF_G00374640 [Aldrovandia affinis]|uniref:Uncharacterized protein n=1 Tax=Aldrovandia affinis TaxID=143900 RepID=A0AAD7SGE2_9TELE|nr:hypothetical protein AAFF_G00374640 [Aldrovandia affinis]
MALTPQGVLHSTACSTLKNFTIPRKKREAGEVFFEPCPKESREYNCIRSTINDSRLDVSKGIGLSWDFQNVRLVHNKKLLREFSEKRCEMRSKGRRGREMEEKFCFLAVADQATGSLCLKGLKAESGAKHTLGNPSCGVYLYRHADVALKTNMANSSTPQNLIIFKVIFGKVKKLHCSLGRGNSQDPTIQFDCYVSKDPADPKECLPQQALGSSAFLFDYDEKQQLLPRPRQCLPYALVLVTPISNVSSLATPVSSTRLQHAGMAPGCAEHLKTCTVSESKGQNATAATATENSTLSQGSTTAFQRLNQVNMHHITTKPGDIVQKAFGGCTYQQWATLFFSELGAMMSNVALGAPMNLFAPTNVGVLNGVQNRLVSNQPSSICVRQNYQYQSLHPSTTVALSNVSTMCNPNPQVVKDPRVAARENRNSRNKAPEELEQDQLTGKIDSECHLMRESALELPSGSQTPDKELTATGSEYGVTGDVCFPESSGIPLQGSSTPDENENSVSQSKIMFQTQAAHLETINKDKIENICSLDDEPLEENKLLVEEIDFHDTYLHPSCSSTTDTEVVQNAVPQKTPEDSGSEVQQQVGLQISGLSTNHFLQYLAELQVVSIPELTSSASVDVEDTSINNCENSAQPLDVKVAEEGAIQNKEETKRSNSQENMVTDIKPRSYFLAPLNLNEKDKIPFIDEPTVCATQVDEGPGSVYNELGSTFECLSDLDHPQSKTAKEPLSNNQTDFLKSQNCRENAENAKVISEGNSEKSVDESCPTVSEEHVCERTLIQMNGPDLTEAESFECTDGNEQNSRVKLKAYFKTNKNSERTLREDLFLVQRSDTEFMGVSGFEEVYDMDVSEEAVNCHTSSVGANENVKKDNPSKKGTYSEKKESEDLCRSTCSEATHICKAHSVDGDLQLSDPIYSMLYNRIQFNQLFPSPSTSGEDSILDKPYLKPVKTESHPDNKTKHSDRFTFQNTSPTHQNCENGKDEPSPSVTKLKCRNRGDQYNLRIAIIADSRNTCLTDLQILSSKISFAKCLKEKHDVSGVVGDNKSTASSNINVTMSVDNDAGEVRLHTDTETDTFEQNLPVVSIACDTKQHSEIRDDLSHATEKQCSASGFQCNYLGKSLSTIQHPATSESSVRKKRPYSKRNRNAKLHVPRKCTVKTTAFHQIMKLRGKKVMCHQNTKSILPESKSGAIRNKISTQEIFFLRKGNLLKGQIKRKTMNSTKICLRSFLMSRKKSFASRGNIGNTVVNNSYTLTNYTNGEFMSNIQYWNQINKKVDLAPMLEVEGRPESLPQTLVPRASDPYNTAYVELPSREDAREIDSCCISNKDNLPQCDLQNGCFTSKAKEQENCSSAVIEEETDKAYDQSEETNRRFFPAPTLASVYNPNDNLPNIRGAEQTHLTSEEKQYWEGGPSITPGENIVGESNVIQVNNHPRHQVYTNNSQRLSSEISGGIADTSHLIRDPGCCSGVQQNDSIYPSETSQTKKNIILHNPWANTPKGNSNHQCQDNPKLINTSFQKDYDMGDISSTLKEADLATSLEELSPLISRCQEMLRHFISAFERDQNVDFNTVVVSRELIAERYMRHPPAPVDLKYEALDSFLELQVVMEATQFVENKMRSISGEPRFRSLLWYDPTLKGDLYKGKVGCQQQSLLYSSHQQCHAYSTYKRLRQYYSHIPTLIHQRQKIPDISHYMYLKNKRERLEVQAALQNQADMDSFFLSLPVSCTVNFGDSLQSLEKLRSFTEAYFNQLQGPIDIGKAEHLLIMHRFISEKINHLLDCKVVDPNLSWFGLEHLRYDASKMLAWKDRINNMLYKSLTTHNDSQQQTFVKMNEAGVSVLKRHAVTEAGMPIQKKRVAVKDCKHQQLGNVCKKKTCTQNKNCETICVEKDHTLNVGRPQKPPAKPTENQRALFQSVTPGCDNTQYQPVNWSALKTQGIELPFCPLERTHLCHC